MTGSSPRTPDGIRFALEGVDELTFARVLRDVMQDPAFARPLQVQAQPPRTTQTAQTDGGQAGTEAALTLAFYPEERTRAVAAMQRLKTIMLRYGVQIDSVMIPE